MRHDFVRTNSIVRAIWGDPDVVLLIFAGAAAEFALNRAVDWLFVTGSLPSDPIGRLFSTVRYAQQIIFADDEVARRTLASISAAHAAVERRRGQSIPDWAYRDVLYMLIDHSQRSYGLLRRPLKAAEQEELHDTFLRVGGGLNISQLPATYYEWQADRERHLRRDLVRSALTERLFEQYGLQAGGIPGLPVDVRVRLAVNTAEAAIDAAIAGVGLARVLSYQAAGPTRRSQARAAETRARATTGQPRSPWAETSATEAAFVHRFRTTSFAQGVALGFEKNPLSETATPLPVCVHARRRITSPQSAARDKPASPRSPHRSTQGIGSWQSPSSTQACAHQ